MRVISPWVGNYETKECNYVLSRGDGISSSGKKMSILVNVVKMMNGAHKMNPRFNASTMTGKRVKTESWIKSWAHEPETEETNPWLINIACVVRNQWRHSFLFSSLSLSSLLSLSKLKVNLHHGSTKDKHKLAKVLSLLFPSPFLLVVNC